MRYNYEKLRASMRDFMSRKKLNQEQFAALCKTSQSRMSEILSGKAEPTELPTITKIIQGMNVPEIEYVLFDDTISESLTKGQRRKYVPLISWINAGKFTERADMNHVGIGEPIPYEGVDDNAYALIVDGDSMEPEFLAGDKIIISPNAQINNGDYCVVELHDLASLKKIIFKGDITLVKSLNSKYEDTIISKQESFRVLGRVVFKVKKY